MLRKYRRARYVICKSMDVHLYCAAAERKRQRRSSTEIGSKMRFKKCEDPDIENDDEKKKMNRGGKIRCN